MNGENFKICFLIAILFLSVCHSGCGQSATAQGPETDAPIGVGPSTVHEDQWDGWNRPEEPGIENEGLGFIAEGLQYAKSIWTNGIYKAFIEDGISRTLEYALEHTEEIPKKLTNALIDSTTKKDLIVPAQLGAGTPREGSETDTSTEGPETETPVESPGEPVTVSAENDVPEPEMGTPKEGSETENSIIGDWNFHYYWPENRRVRTFVVNFCKDGTSSGEGYVGRWKQNGNKISYSVGTTNYDGLVDTHYHMSGIMSELYHGSGEWSADRIQSVDEAGVCPSGQTDCGSGYCQDIRTDVTNCGQCGKVCPIGGACTDGVCVCPSGEVDCGSGYCSDIMSDNYNCGKCGNVCSTLKGEICYKGICISDTYYVSDEVPWIKQGETETCWAAAATTLYSSIKNESYTIDSVMEIAGPYFYQLFYATDPSLSKEDLNKLVNSLGFAHEPEETIDYSIKDWVYLLKKYGLLWVVLDTGAKSPALTHGIIVYGIEPRIGFPATPEYTTIFYVDPVLGPDQMPVEEFTNRFVGTGVENIRIVHDKNAKIEYEGESYHP